MNQVTVTVSFVLFPPRSRSTTKVTVMFVYWTYEKAVRGGGGREKGEHALRTPLAAACAFESGHLKLLSGAGEGEVVSKEVGEEERGARGVDRRSDNAPTSVDIDIDPHRRRLGRSQTDFAGQAIVECRARRKRNESQCCCAGMPVAVKCAVVSRWACRKRRRRNSQCIREDHGAGDGRNQSFVAIVSKLRAVCMDLLARSNMQRCIEVLGWVSKLSGGAARNWQICQIWRNCHICVTAR